MAKRQSAKQTAGQRNAERRNGKAWKRGKSPAVREAEARAKSEAKRARKEAVAA